MVYACGFMHLHETWLMLQNEYLCHTAIHVNILIERKIHMIQARQSVKLDNLLSRFKPILCMGFAQF